MATKNKYSFSYFCNRIVIEEKIHTFLSNSGFSKDEEGTYRINQEHLMGSVKYSISEQDKMLFLTVHPKGRRSDDIMRFQFLIAPLIQDLAHK